MDNIENIDLLSYLLKGEELERLDFGAHLYKRHGRIYFKVVEVGDRNITIEVRQDKNILNNYPSADKLIYRTKDLFGRFLSGYEIAVRTKPYKIPNK